MHRLGMDIIELPDWFWKIGGYSSHLRAKVSLAWTKAKETIIPLINVGTGGYYNLHRLKVNVGTVDDETGIKLLAANDKLHGHLTLTIDANLISGVVTLVNENGDGGSLHGDAFTYPSKAKYLKEGQEIKLGQEALANRE
jgi:hypothetical protein